MFTAISWVVYTSIVSILCSFRYIILIINIWSLHSLKLSSPSYSKHLLLSQTLFRENLRSDHPSFAVFMWCISTWILFCPFVTWNYICRRGSGIVSTSNSDGHDGMSSAHAESKIATPHRRRYIDWHDWPPWSGMCTTTAPLSTVWTVLRLVTSFWLAYPYPYPLPSARVRIWSGWNRRTALTWVCLLDLKEQSFRAFSQAEVICYSWGVCVESESDWLYDLAPGYRCRRGSWWLEAR